MTIDETKLRRTLAGLQDEVQGLLSGLIEVQSVRGGEGPAMRLVREALARCCDMTEFVQIPDSIRDDPDYCFRLPGINYADRPNVRASRTGSSSTGPLFLLNTHLDVVPPSIGQEAPWVARSRADVVYGRGACDAKGQAATIYAVMRALAGMNVRLPATIEAHLVVEEECGGNGTLAMVRHLQTRGASRRADACIVLEPSGLKVMPSVRGAMWFRLKVLGRAGHSGMPGSSVSALKKAVVAIGVLEKLHDRLLAESRGNPLFDAFADPMPVTFGICQAGNWPAAAPAEAVLEGVFGFLPPRKRAEIRRLMEDALRTCSDEWLREHFELTFPMLRADGNVLDVSHPLVTTMQQSLTASGVEPQLSALTGSCDARFYANDLAVPTVVFGPGDLGHAHGKDEQIRLGDILTAAEVIIRTFDRLARAS